MKKRSSKSYLSKILLALGILLLFSSVSAIGYYRYLISPLNPDETGNQKFPIEKGESVSSVAGRLKSQKIIRSDLAFKLYLRLNRPSSTIQAGEHLVSPSMNIDELLIALGSGKSDVWITFPEGLRSEEIQEIIKDELSLDVPISSLKSNEGMLYPDTYLVPIDITAEDLIAVMLNNYETKIAPLRKDIPQTGLTEKEVVNLAAIIERETLSEGEKPIVAGILLKRMQSGWGLETDANIQYIIGTKEKWWPIPTIADRSIESPYNTYLNQGLPPAPIANPSITSIEAVIYSEPSDYWFYLHDKSGKIRYGRTLDEHNNNINKYIR